MTFWRKILSVIGGITAAVTLATELYWPYNKEVGQFIWDYIADPAIIKQLTWHYVIHDSALTSQQLGHRKIIRHLFETFNDTKTPNLLDLFPLGYREQVNEMIRDGQDAPTEERIRLVTDLIAGMTESQAISMYQRLTGMNLGTVLDRIVR